MPSREEIVEWLRDAETLAKIWRNECDIRGLPRQANGIDQDAQLLHKRASQVAAMRCETCKHYDDTYQICEVIGPSERYIPESFGCFHHEQRE